MYRPDEKMNKFFPYTVRGFIQYRNRPYKTKYFSYLHSIQFKKGWDRNKSSNYSEINRPIGRKKVMKLAYCRIQIGFDKSSHFVLNNHF